jgi:hypothetical protein
MKISKVSYNSIEFSLKFLGGDGKLDPVCFQVLEAVRNAF